MKILQISKVLSFTLVVWLIPAMPTLGNPFYDLLPDAKQEEIRIIDDYTVEVGMGLDNRSVSCNIMDALQSIPYVGPRQEPETVFVNNEKVYHFRKGLYTWDKEGKYRVRLTTKYISEFGNIRIFVPKEVDLLQKQFEPILTKPTSSYLQNLPQKIREEITIIDENTVEVAIGPDDRSVSSTILHAIKSIPSVKEDTEPEQVFVNEERIYRIKEGIYTWDVQGKNPVRLTTKYIRNSGNIQIQVAGKEPPSISKEEPLISIEPIAPPEKEPAENLIEKPEKKFQKQYSTNEKPGVALSPEVIVPPSPLKEEHINPSSPPVQKKKKMGFVKGFRLANFGMNEQQIIQAIETDFGLPEKEIEIRKISKSGQRVLTITSLRLDPDNGKARINYYLDSHDQRLNRVDVVWGHPEHSSVDISILQNSAERFKNLFNQFRQLQTPSPNNHATKEPYIFYGLDTSGNGIKIMWAKPLDNNFQPITDSESTLALSYFQSNSKASNP